MAGVGGVFRVACINATERGTTTKPNDMRPKRKPCRFISSGASCRQKEEVPQVFPLRISTPVVSSRLRRAGGSGSQDLRGQAARGIGDGNVSRVLVSPPSIVDVMVISHGSTRISQERGSRTVTRQIHPFATLPWIKKGRLRILQQHSALFKKYHKV